MHQIQVLKGALLRTNSSILGAISMAGFRVVEMMGRELPGVVRLFLDALQPVDPMRRRPDLPSIEILIPFVLKDLEMLAHSTFAAVLSSRNPVSRVRLVTPERTLERGGLLLKPVREDIVGGLEAQGVLVSFETDEGVVPAVVRNYITELGLAPRYHGWLSAQAVKLMGAWGGQAAATLIVDADTVLTFKRTWLDQQGCQILMIGQESREAFFKYASEYLGISSRPRLSYITHHQLMQRDLLRELFPRGSKDIIRWIAKGRPKNSDSAEGGLRHAEYELYGAFLDNLKRKRRKYATWGNGTGVRQYMSELLIDPHKWALSTSFHHYKSRNNTPDRLL